MQRCGRGSLSEHAGRGFLLRRQVGWMDGWIDGWMEEGGQVHVRDSAVGAFSILGMMVVFGLFCD